MTRIITIVIILMTFSACEKKEIITEYTIDRTLSLYLDRFYAEAELRGFSFEKSNLILKFAETPNKDLCGTCSKSKKNEKAQRTIEINRDLVCWTGKSDLEKEMLVFHELGHCFLNRVHLDDFYSDGSAKSLMTSLPTQAYTPCLYDFGGTNFDENICNKSNRRDFYINELFTNNQIAPFWIK